MNGTIGYYDMNGTIGCRVAVKPLGVLLRFCILPLQLEVSRTWTDRLRYRSVEKTVTMPKVKKRAHFHTVVHVHTFTYAILSKALH